MPFSPIIVSYACGKFSIKSAAAAKSQAFLICSSDAFKFAYAIFARTVSSNNIMSWLTKEIFFLREDNVMLQIFCPSILKKLKVHPI